MHAIAGHRSEYGFGDCGVRDNDAARNNFTERGVGDLSWSGSVHHYAGHSSADQPWDYNSSQHNLSRHSATEHELREYRPAICYLNCGWCLASADLTQFANNSGGSLNTRPFVVCRRPWSDYPQQ